MWNVVHGVFAVLFVLVGGWGTFAPRHLSDFFAAGQPSAAGQRLYRSRGGRIFVWCSSAPFFLIGCIEALHHFAGWNPLHFI